MVSQADDRDAITFDPPSVQPGQTLRAGQVMEFAATRHVRVTGTRAFLVSQFMLGQGPETVGMPGAGDPSMVFEVPVQQYRSQYSFYVPTTYPTNYINVTAPAARAPLLDDAPLAGTPESVSGYDVYAVPIPSGAHRLRSEGARPSGSRSTASRATRRTCTPGGLDLSSSHRADAPPHAPLHGIESSASSWRPSSDRSIVPLRRRCVERFEKSPALLENIHRAEHLGP